MRITGKKIGAAVVLTVLFFFASHSGMIFAADVIPGIRAGYSQLAGYYERDLDSGPCAGIFVLYHNPALCKYVKAEADFSLARYPFGKSGNSALYSFPVSLGPLFSYPVASNVELYAGAAGTGRYMYIRAEDTGSESSTFKFGGAVKAGMFIFIGAGVSARADACYDICSLSGRAFQAVNFTAGIAYNHGQYVRGRSEDEASSRELKSARAYADGVEYFNRGDLKKAKEKFRDTLDQDKGHRGAAGYMARIASLENAFSRAGELAAQKKYYEAIPLLEPAAKDMHEAKSELARIRKLLFPEIPGLEKTGIEAYERGDFAYCIEAMKKIGLIDPENAAVKLYLPRAQKRYETLYRLK